MSTRADWPKPRWRRPRRRPTGESASRGRRRAVASRLIPVLLAVLAVVGTFAAILLMTVRITDGQYRLVELRREEQALQQESESLTQDLEFHQAPQNLARSAQDEGLVPAPSQQGVVDLSSGEVSGQAEPAAEGDGDDVDIAIPPPIQTGSSAADAAAQEARARTDALPSSDDEARTQLERAREAEADVDLHGGTIPAPQQRPGSTGPGDDEASSAPSDDAAPSDGNPEAPEGHTPLSGPAEVPEAPAPGDADGAAGTDPAAGTGGAGADGAAGAGQDPAQGAGTGEGAGQ